MDDSLLSGDLVGPREPDHAKARGLLINFILMSAYFSANHGCVTSVIALASSFDKTLGSYSLGVLYACYVVTAMLFAQSMMSFSSEKGALIVSLALYSVYVGSYIIAAFLPATEWYSVLFGATIGGIGAGLLWTAQGAYFKINAKLYAEAKCISEEEAAGYFSSLFASFYLGFEVLLKVIGSLVAMYAHSKLGENMVYALYTIVAIASTFGIATVRPMHSQHAKPQSHTEKITAALRLLFTNPKCALMLPTNFAFGFASAFMTAYIQGSVIAPVHDDVDDDDKIESEEELHASRVLLYSSIAVGTATLLAMPFNALRQKLGSPVAVMGIGSKCFMFVGAITFLLGDRDLRKIMWLIFLVYGAGRSVWESTVKAVFADFFSEEDAPAAFANIILQSGISACFGFFVFPNLSQKYKAVFVVATSSFGMMGYLYANHLYKREKKTHSNSLDP